MLRWVWENLGSLVLAFVLSFTVWVVAVTTEDPLVERTFSLPIPIQYLDLGEGLTIVGETPREVRVTLRAPESAWQGLRTDDIVARVELGGLAAGSFEVPVVVEVSRRPAQVSAVEPARLRLTLEPASSVTLPIQVVQLGETAVGTRVASMRPTPDSAVVRGPSSSVARIAGLRAEMDVTGWPQSGDDEAVLSAYDREGRAVADVEITPAQI
ncbi:MAG: CdaR family protein, partial [Anaerolineales bacterium]